MTLTTPIFPPPPPPPPLPPPEGPADQSADQSEHQHHGQADPDVAAGNRPGVGDYLVGDEDCAGEKSGEETLARESLFCRGPGHGCRIDSALTETSREG